MIKLNKLLSPSLISFVGLYAFGPVQALAENSFEDILKNGSVFGQLRYRYEHVEQDNFPLENANASTIRANIGYKTGEFEGFQALAEGQFVTHIGDDTFNDSVNGRTGYPVIADPDGAEFNQYWLSWNGIPKSKLTVGRQKIDLDNQRFIGSVDWRQNDQTLDAVQFKNNSLKNVEWFYLYSYNVNRIQGNKHPLGDLDSNIHVFNAAYNAGKELKLVGYGYWIEFKQLASQSSKTFGLRATGALPVNADWNFSYEAEIATQSENANNPLSFSETYYHIAPSVTGYGFTLKAGYEVLGSDGVAAFQTPLATLHKFNGWADAFLSTPINGLRDYYLSAAYKISGVDNLVDGMVITAVYHKFDDDQSLSGDFGNELDLSAGKTFTNLNLGPIKSLNVLLKYADYNGTANIPGRKKFWFQLGAGF